MLLSCECRSVRFVYEDTRQGFERMPVSRSLQADAILDAMAEEKSTVDHQTNALRAAATGETWLIWDGECGFCRRCVKWLRAHDGEQHFRITSYQTCPWPPMTPELYAQSKRAVQVVAPGGHRISGGRAVLFVLQTVGWHPLLVRIAGLPPFVWIVELGYRIVSRNRSFFSRLLFRRRSSGE